MVARITVEHGHLERAQSNHAGILRVLLFIIHALRSFVIGAEGCLPELEPPMWVFQRRVLSVARRLGCPGKMATLCSWS